MFKQSTLIHKPSLSLQSHLHLRRVIYCQPWWWTKAIFPKRWILNVLFQVCRRNHYPKTKSDSVTYELTEEAITSLVTVSCYRHFIEYKIYHFYIWKWIFTIWKKVHKRVQLNLIQTIALCNKEKTDVTRNSNTILFSVTFEGSLSCNVILAVQTYGYKRSQALWVSV